MLGPSESELLLALEHNNVDVVRRIAADHKASEVGARDGDDRVALHYAAEGMPIEVVQDIYQSDASLLDATDSLGMTPLLMAVQAGRLEVASFLSEKGASLSHSDEEGHGVLHWAVVCGQHELLTWLLDQGKVDINAADSVGATALHYATAADEVSPDVASSILLTLLRKGASVSVKDSDGRTPLLWSASNGNIEALLSLKQAGADVAAVDRDCLGALHCASSHGNIQMLRTLLPLLSPSAVHSRDRNGFTPLFYAASYGHVEAARLLLTKDANTNEQDDRLRTAAHCAASKGQLRMLKLLKQFGASFSIQNYRGDLPLHEAVQVGAVDVVEWLLAVNPSSCSSAAHSGRTPLHMAAASGSMQLTRILCNAGAPLDALMTLRQQQVTALDVAEQRKHQDVADYLRIRMSTLHHEPSQTQNTSDTANERPKSGENKENIPNGPIKRTAEKNTTKSNGNLLAAVARSTSTSELFENTEEPSRAEMLIADRIGSILIQELKASQSRERGGKGRRKWKVKKENGEEKDHRDQREKEEEEEEGFSEEEEAGDEEGEERVDSGQSIHDGDEELSESRDSIEEQGNGERKKKKGRGESIGREESREERETRKKRTVSMEEKLRKMNTEESLEIYEDDWESIQEGLPHNIGKDAHQYLHEKAIFEELTHLKRMQIQYGKVQEKILVHTLVHNFCKMHGLNPANFKFTTFYSWEKFLYEQLKALYLRERQWHAGRGGSRPARHSIDRLNKFENRLRQARAVPLDDRIRELTRVYSSGSCAAGKVSTGTRPSQPVKSVLAGTRRCDCLGHRHLLFNQTSKTSSSSKPE